MRVVIDSGPLLVLSKLNILKLLTQLFDEILIPDKVYYEVVSKGLKIGKKDAFILNNFFIRYKDKIKIIKT